MIEKFVNNIDLVILAGGRGSRIKNLLGKYYQDNLSNYIIPINYFWFIWSIIKIYTNQDIVGLGEVRDGASARYALSLKSKILGENPCDIDWSNKRNIRNDSCTASFIFFICPVPYFNFIYIWIHLR